MKTDTSYYGIYMQGYNLNVDATMPATVTLKFASVAVGHDPMDSMDKFMRDITLMNSIRMSTDPAVKDEFEKLLTIMALTNGRVMK